MTAGQYKYSSLLGSIWTWYKLFVVRLRVCDLLADATVKYVNKVAVEKKGKSAKTKLVAKTGGAHVRQWDIMKMMVPGEGRTDGGAEGEA